jgi:hypothetical protein
MFESQQGSRNRLDNARTSVLGTILLALGILVPLRCVTEIVTGLRMSRLGGVSLYPSRVSKHLLGVGRRPLAGTVIALSFSATAALSFSGRELCEHILAKDGMTNKCVPV